MKSYIEKLYETRYFWLHLVNADLKSRFRRSKLGILWVLLNPLLLTMLMSLVFGTIFHSPLRDYAPYILSGLIVWDIVSASFIGGGSQLLAAEQYIRQINHPMTIYTLKWALLTIITFLIATISLCIWVLFLNPINVLWGILTLPLTALIYLSFCWPISTLSAFINTKYRDYPQMIALIIQAVWYVSPVFFKQEMFLSSPVLEKVFYLNPLTHILNLLRAPFLYGVLPTLADYAFSVAFAAFWSGVAYLIYRKFKDKIIFYI